MCVWSYANTRRLALKFDKLPPVICTCTRIFIICFLCIFSIHPACPCSSYKKRINDEKWNDNNENKNDKHHKHVNNNMNVVHTTYPCDHHPFLFWRFNCWIFISVTRIKWILFNAIIGLSANTWINEHKLEQHKPMETNGVARTHKTNTNSANMWVVSVERQWMMFTTRFDLYI